MAGVCVSAGTLALIKNQKHAHSRRGLVRRTHTHTANPFWAAAGPNVITQLHKTSTGGPAVQLRPVPVTAGRGWRGRREVGSDMNTAALISFGLSSQFRAQLEQTICHTIGNTIARARRLKTAHQIITHCRRLMRAPDKRRPG